MKFRPLHDRVVVKRIDAEDKTRMAKKLNLQESRVVISCLYSLTACRPVEF
jgi:co-chaperonin GroES (HSP10)